MKKAITTLVSEGVLKILSFSGVVIYCSAVKVVVYVTFQVKSSNGMTQIHCQGYGPKRNTVWETLNVFGLLLCMHLCLCVVLQVSVVVNVNKIKTM